MEKITFIFLGIGFTSSSSSKSQAKNFEPKQANGENSAQKFFCFFVLSFFFSK